MQAQYQAHTGSGVPATADSPEKLGESPGTFATNEMCWSSRLVLRQGRRYLITITTHATNRWFDRGVPTDVMGFPSSSFHHVIARPLTRWWNEPWFKPIARIGQYGNDEYVLDSVDLATAWKQPPCDQTVKPLKAVGSFEPIPASIAQLLNACAPVPADRTVLNAEIKPRSTGELFIYVNDAITAIPGLQGMFYANNSGLASVRVTTIESAAEAAESRSSAPPASPVGR